VFVISGLAVIAAVLLDQAHLGVAVLLAAAVIPVIYSYVVYRRVSSA
jgi:hypothetical protein